MFLRRVLAHCAVGLFVIVAASEFGFGQMQNNSSGASRKVQNCLFDELRAGAMAGDPADEKALSFLYQQGGGGIPKDEGESLRWLASAAEHGDYGAADILIAREHDEKEAKRLSAKFKDRLISSVNQEDANAQYWIGQFYYQGADRNFGIAKSPDLQMQWFSKAAEHNDYRAALALMDLYRQRAAKSGAQEDAVQSANWRSKALNLLKAAAESGSPKAQLELAARYHNGSFGDTEDEEALKWVATAAPRSFRANVAAALILLVKSNPDTALALKRVQRNGCAEFALAEAFRQGFYWQWSSFFSIPKEGLPEQMRMLQASEWLSRAVADGNLDAQIYQMQHARTNEEAFAILRHLAEQGEVKSQYELSGALMSGRWWVGSHQVSVEKDEAAGMRWLERAAAQTGDYAQQARTDLQQIETQKHEEEAKVRQAEERKRAAEEEDRRIENGTWTPEEKLMNAAKQGDARSEALVASAFTSQEQHVSLHDNKDAAAKYHKQAVDWYRKAAEGGDAESQRVIAEIYFTGKDLPRDWNAGLAWLKKSADQGHSSAEMELGAYYRGFFWGEEVPEDPDLAKYWYTRAAEHGNKEAQEIVQRGGWVLNSSGKAVPASSAGNRPIPPGSTRILAFIPYLTTTVGKVGYHFTSNLVSDCPGWWDKHGEPHGAGHWGSDSQDFIGSLPPGLKWTENFGIEGTPEQPGNWTVTVRFHGLYCTLDDEHNKKPVDIGPKNEWTFNLKIEGDAPRRVK